MTTKTRSSASRSSRPTSADHAVAAAAAANAANAAGAAAGAGIGGGGGGGGGGPSSSISSSSSSSSYRVLQFVQDLRSNTEQASKQLNDILAANDSIGEALKKEKNDEKRLLKEMQAILEQTKTAQSKATLMQSKLLDLEARQGVLTWQKHTVEALEAEASKTMETYKQELALALAKHQAELQVEVGKAVELHRQLDGVVEELGGVEKGLKAAREEANQSKTKLVALEKEREGLGKELRGEKQEIQRLKQQVLPQLAQETTETEESMWDVEAMTGAYKTQNEEEKQKRRSSGGGGGGGGRGSGAGGGSAE